MEFNCILITDNLTGEIKALPPTEIILVEGREIFDYEQKYMPGKVNERTPARCNPEIIKKYKKSQLKQCALCIFRTWLALMVL